MNDKGWFKVPGIRPAGDRTLAEQMLGMGPALAECKCRTVLDLGCAEGLIGREFALAGAASVAGIELLQSHLDVAKVACKDAPACRFIRSELGEWIAAHPEPERFDIVLCLGIIHKLKDPNLPLRFAARSTQDLLLFRGPGTDRLKICKGIIRSKFSTIECDVPKVLSQEGFKLERIIDGVRGEAVHYWRRRPSAVSRQPSATPGAANCQLPTGG